MATNLVPDRLIEDLVPDASAVPPLKRRFGWLGKSPRRNHWRLYLTLGLSSYIEFHEEAVVHALPLTGDQRPLGGTLIFLKHDAELILTRTTARQAQAEWLSGDVMRALWGSQGGAVGGFAPNPPGTVEFNPTWIFATIAILVLASVVGCRDDGGSSDFTLTGTTLCTGSPGSC